MDNIKEETKKWYDKKGVLILFLFLLPPFGVYGILLRKTETWKKLLYSFLAVFTSLYLFGVLIMLTSDTDFSYERGESMFKKGLYRKAITEYKKVNTNSNYFKNAQEKIELANLKLDSINKTITAKKNEDKRIENLKIEKLIGVQKIWADSVFKSESKRRNKHFVSVNYKLPDTILFEYTENITKKGFNANLEADTFVYRENYKKFISNKLGKEYLKQKCFISFLPNKTTLSKHNPNDWQHPTFLNEGLKIYSGNRYDKKYLGILTCKFKDKKRSSLDGNRFVVVKKPNKELVSILRHELTNYYWIKKSDKNKNNAKGLSECY